MFGLASNIIENTTKPTAARCAAVYSAFFMPVRNASLNFLGLYSIKNTSRISKYGRVDRTKYNTQLGNTSSRLLAVVETRPPVLKAGGQHLTKPTGGHIMPNTSKSAAIRTIQTINTPSGIIATIHTRYHQKAVIGRLFTSFEQLKDFIQSQGLSLDLLGGRI